MPPVVRGNEKSKGCGSEFRPSRTRNVAGPISRRERGVPTPPTKPIGSAVKLDVQPRPLQRGERGPRQQDCMIDVRLARPDDAPAWLHLRHALRPDGSLDEDRAQIDRFFAGEARDPQAVLLAEDATGRIVGLAELSIRPHAEGCRTNRVAYLDGWFVVPAARGRGVSRALVSAAEQWAR